VHEGKLSDTIAINTGVSQGCILDDLINKMLLGKKGEKLIRVSHNN
jgi:hypothetical protein